MKKFILGISSAIAIVSSSSALAQPSFPIDYIGTLALDKGGPTLYCDFEVSFLNATQVEITRLTNTYPCNTFTVNSNPHSYSFDPVNNDLEVYGLNVTTTLTEGDCEGTLLAKKYSTHIDATTTLAGGGSTADCNIEGQLDRVYP